MSGARHKAQGVGQRRGPRKAEIRRGGVASERVAVSAAIVGIEIKPVPRTGVISSP
jgi:hypothetical protein